MRGVTLRRLELTYFLGFLGLVSSVLSAKPARAVQILQSGQPDKPGNHTAAPVAATAAAPVTVSEANPIVEAVTFGRFDARGTWRAPAVSKKQCTALLPAIVLLPGSGPNGPEEMMPGAATLDGKDTALLDAFALALNANGLATLQVGKPGVERFKGFQPSLWYYNKALYDGLKWVDLVANAKDALAFVAAKPCIDPARIFLLGHSEGTQVAIDISIVATASASAVPVPVPTPAGLILLGFTGSDFAHILDWQVFEREVELFINTDVDANHDGLVSRAEAALWPEFSWPWQPGQDTVKVTEIRAALRAIPQKKAIIELYKKLPLYGDGIWERGPLYEKAAGLAVPLFVFNGAKDVRTPAWEAKKLQDACVRAKKKNCEVSFVPEVGHAFSIPRPPRSQPLLHETLGPVSPDFLQVLGALGKRLAQSQVEK